ncbi:hypothetical protein JOD54_005265 [Actinokineospora baliensis]|uniref:hypothetical protein n=1 Tax=Actinokineospora baliensis TaxID=547056 RepID=UPI0019595664|nr:hypothetical protein [Actinokineospora baliensis]MBM7775061.1 hypothetical protein [Actinokineospora baliensis]
MLDVLRAVDGDPRLEFSWTINEGSTFAGGLRERLLRLEVRLIEWREARAMTFDLIVAAHTDEVLGELSGPLATMAHGCGYNRRVLWRTMDPDAPVGLSARELLRDGEVVAAAIGLSCEAQGEQLFRANPLAAPRAFQMGDPTWDRMVANGDMRDRFRRELRVGPRQRLVGISSTWGPDSTLGVDRVLVNRVLAALPRDEYRVVLILHPNVWAHHSGFGVLGMLGDAVEAGLVVVRPTTDWPAPLIAVDAFIGDHGSVSVYAAALGRPFLFAGRGDDDLVKGSTTVEFVRAAGKFSPGRDPREQVVEIMRTYAGSGVAEVARNAMGNQGRSLRLLQEKFYDLMALDRPPDVPHPRRYGPLKVVRDERGVTAFHCAITDRPGNGIVVERFPASLAAYRSSEAGPAVLVVDEHETNQDLKDTAEIRVRGDHNDAATVWARITSTLLHSQCFLAVGVNGSRVLVGSRSGGRWVVTRVAGVPLDPAVAACAVYHRVVEVDRGRPGAEESTVEVELGATSTTVAITRRRAAPVAPNW